MKDVHFGRLSLNVDKGLLTLVMLNIVWHQKYF